MAEAPVPPKLSCDCHVHVIGPKARFPLARERTYTPKDATLDDLRAMMVRLGLARAVLVQPSIYGTDNTCMMNAIDELGDAARGVAVLPPDTSAVALDDLHRRGIRGIRVNVASVARSSLDAIRRRFADAAKLCARNGWHVQTFLPADAIAPLSATMLQLPVAVVIDHFGLVAPRAPHGPDNLVRLLASGRIWVKLSAPYRIGDDIADPAIGALARRLAAANPERVVWASDWPHTPPHGEHRVDGGVELPYRAIDTKRLLGLVQVWFDDPHLQSLVLAGNPARLYGFG